MRIAVIGSGAVGTVLATCLGEIGHEVSVADAQREVLRALRTDGLRVHGRLDRTHRPAAVYDGLEVLDHGPYDFVFLVLKVPVLTALSPEIARRDRPGTQYVVACNGLESEVALVRRLGPQRVHRLVLNLAAGVSAPAVAQVVSFMGDSKIGPMDGPQLETSRRVAVELTRGGVTTDADEQILVRIWEKAILNSSLNALCAVTHLTMKSILNHKDGQELMTRTLREAIRVARANGIALAYDFFDHAMAYLKRGGDHYPSMASDLRMGREVEIEYLNAAIVSAGERCGVPTPYSFALTTLVRLLIEHP